MGKSNKQNQQDSLGIKEWLFEHIEIKRLIDFFKHFCYIGILLLLLLIVMACSSQNNWSVILSITRILLILMLALILLRPMNAVYGLMGTNGSIKLFFILFLAISFLFAGVYYCGFFQKAGICYDVNQPHIDFSLYDYVEKPGIGGSTTVQLLPEQKDTIELLRIFDGETKLEKVVNNTNEEHYYQQISFEMVLRNTIMTTLMQEPTDFFAAASTFNTQMELSDKLIVCNGDKKLSIPYSRIFLEGQTPLNGQKTSLFHWILISQVLISWIFFGVFISLLYSKFRYES